MMVMADGVSVTVTCSLQQVKKTRQRRQTGRYLIKRNEGSGRESHALIEIVVLTRPTAVVDDAIALLPSTVAVGDFAKAKYPNNPSELPHKSSG
jgi:hypothetical protein